MKIIKQEELDALIVLLEKYNIGVAEYSAVRKMFEALPEAPTTDEKVVEETLDK